LHTISLVDADESKCGETPFIREVLRGGRVIPHIVGSDQVSDMTGPMMESDEPFEIAGYFSNWFGFAAANQAGVRVLLDGISGDHITPPYSYLSTMVRSFKWRAVLRELSFSSRVYGDPRLPNLMRFGIGPIAPGLFVALRWLARGRGTAPYPKDSLIDHDFAVRMRILDRLELRRRTLWKAARNIDTLHSWSFTCGVLPGFFEQSSRMAATMGVETRHPFSDRRVIEFFLSLPLEMKTYGPLPKRVIRAGMEGILPELVRCRTRYAHPGQAFQSSLLARHAELLRPVAFKETLGPVRPYVNLNVAESARNSAAIGSPEAGSSVWKLLNLALWLGSRNL
jgi:asparagine synthase (glutamine-hydrolysing)